MSRLRVRAAAPCESAPEWGPHAWAVRDTAELVTPAHHIGEPEAEAGLSVHFGRCCACGLVLLHVTRLYADSRLDRPGAPVRLFEIAGAEL